MEFSRPFNQYRMDPVPPVRLARRKAFTLIEILVVVAIIALLVSILLPSLARARDQARSAVCTTHERQMGEAMTIFATEYKGRVPRGLSQHPSVGNLTRPPNWIRMIARMFGNKNNYEANFNRVPVEKYEVYSCPVRSAEYDGNFLDYVVNSTDSRGPIVLAGSGSSVPTWYEVEGTTKIDVVWNQPSKAAYILDGVEESWNVVNGGRSLNLVRQNIAAIRAMVDPNITMTGFDWFDIPGGYSVPTYRKFVDTTRMPRAALKMHLGLGSNAVFADAHVEMIKPPPQSVGALEVSRFYFRKLGVDPKIVPKITDLGADASTLPGVQGDITWRPGMY